MSGSSASVVIQPEGYQAKGTIPRKALAGGLIVLTLVGGAAYLATADTKEVQRPDTAAVQKLNDGDAAKAQVPGSPKVVDEAEEAARRELAREEAARAGGLPYAKPASAPEAVAVARSISPVPVLSSPAPAAAATPAIDPGEAARELADRSAKPTVFDAGTSSSAADAAGVLAQLPNVERQLQQAIGNVGGAGGGGAGTQGAQQALDPLAQLAQVLRPGAAGAGASNSPRAWAEKMEQSRDAPAVLTANPPAGDLMVVQGTVIPAVTTRQVNSDIPGVLTARVSMDVYDSRTSRRLLIPKGALLVGAYNESVSFGQDRLQFAFTRLRMPDGSTFELPGSSGSDQAGRAGVAGDVDRHFLRTFGSALLLGVLADRVTERSALPNSSAYGGSGSGLSATGQVFVDAARAELERMKSTPTTIRIPEGSRINVEVTRDMLFPTVYQGRGF